MTYEEMSRLNRQTVAEMSQPDIATSSTPDWYSQPIEGPQRRNLRGTQTELRRTTRQLESQGMDVDAEVAKAQDKGMFSTLLDPIFDALQIGQFVTAGTALEIQKNGLGAEALKRAASEFTNALPGVEIDDIVDFYGIKFPKATRPSWSEVLKKADAKVFNDNEYGRWGAAVGGFALDVLLDPMTYLNPLGAASRVPGVLNAARSVENFAKTSRLGKNLGEKFIKDFDLHEWARINPDKASSVANVIEARGIREAEQSAATEEMGNTLRGLTQDMNAAEVRLIHTFMQDPNKLGEVLNLVTLANPERKSELLKKADDMRAFYLDLGKKDAEGGMFSQAVLDAYSVRNGKVYVPGRIPSTIKTDKASQELVQRLKDRGIDIEEKIAPPTVTGEVGQNGQLGAGRPTAGHQKTFQTMPERILSGTPTELDMSLAAGRGLESIRWNTTQRFVKSVLSDATIARPVKSGHVAELFGKTEDDIVDGLIKGGMDSAEAQALGKSQFDELQGFTSRLKRDGYGVYRPMRKGEKDPLTGEKISAWILPEPFIKQLDMSDKVFTKPSESRKFLKEFQALQTIWKGYAVLSPGFHARNMFSNMWNNKLAGVTSPYYYKAFLLQQGKLGDEIKATVNGVEYAGEKLFEQMQRHDIIGTGVLSKDLGLDVERQMLGEIIPKSSGRELEKVLSEGGYQFAADIAGTSPQRNVLDVAKSLVGSENTLLKYNRLTGRAIENNARAAHFLWALDKGASFSDAAMSTKKYLFDYNELTDFERDVMKTALPFYAWMRFNIPLQFQSILEKPGRYAAMTAKPIQEIESITQDWEDIPTPDYFQEMRAIRLPKAASEGIAYLNRQLSGAEDTGLQPTYLNPNLPFQDVNRLNTQDFLSGLSPIVKLAFEQTPTKGFSFFLDRNIESYPGESAQTDVLGTGIRLSGKHENAARSIMPTYGKIQRLRENADQGQLASQILTEGFGIKAIQVDIDRINRSNIYTKREIIRNLKRQLEEESQVPR